MMKAAIIVLAVASWAGLIIAPFSHGLEAVELVGMGIGGILSAILVTVVDAMPEGRDNVTADAVLRPGDKLVVTCEPPLSASYAATLIKAYERQLPGVEVVPVEAQDVKIYRPDGIEVIKPTPAEKLARERNR